ncbi:MAG: hypothetical protein MI919_20510 [Holophagales bacterium]|nr:hypothetical protein [Holophagales bacterium]
MLEPAETPSPDPSYHLHPVPEPLSPAPPALLALSGRPLAAGTPYPERSGRSKTLGAGVPNDPADPPSRPADAGLPRRGDPRLDTPPRVLIGCSAWDPPAIEAEPESHFPDLPLSQTDLPRGNFDRFRPRSKYGP